MKNKGFTLAEILIVLTIIGVLAVMTIPSLIQHANSQNKIALFVLDYWQLTDLAFRFNFDKSKFTLHKSVRTDGLTSS